MTEASCEVCEGYGIYPIHNRYGRELYSIRCPECHGDGSAPDARDPEPADLSPRSTAASIQSLEDMKAHVRAEWSTP